MGLHTMSNPEREGRAPQGLAGRLLDAWRLMRQGGAGRKAPREMRVVESLAVGGRNQLHLVSCGGERFLVGTGPESVGTIVQVRSHAAAIGLARSPAERM